MEIVLLIILIVLVVALFVVSYMKKKKYNTELSQMRSELKIGDKVMTDTGVVGEVVDSYIEDEYTYFVLRTGKGNNIGYFTVHANAIYYVYGKEEKATTQKVVVKAPTETKKEDKKDIADEPKSNEKSATNESTEDENKESTDSDKKKNKK